ncbi:MAG: hypothetical protein CMJ74_09090 [Planctomycetaceae bacterium]|nr:hypothetical protein [Planctomycetaceae bacterium]
MKPAYKPEPKHVVRNFNMESASGANGKQVWLRHGVMIVVGIGIAIAVGEYLGPEVLELKDWIASQGSKGPIIFLLLFVLLSSIFVPDTVFAVIAGALFGILAGTLLMFIGGVLAAMLNFYLARTLFRKQVRSFLTRHPRFLVVEQAAEHEGLRLLVLLRLIPLNPATVSYLLGTTSVRFSLFLIASIGLIPGFFVEVYFGYLLNHVSSANTTDSFDVAHMAVTIIGFILCVGTLVYLIVVARRALAEIPMNSQK